MIIKFDGIKNILPEELTMIINISNEVIEKQRCGVIGDVSFIVSSNTEEDQLEINVKLQRNRIFRFLNNKKEKNLPASPPRK